MNIKYKAWDKENKEYWDFEKERDGITEGYLFVDNNFNVVMSLIGGIKDVTDRFDIEFESLKR